ncbi:MAG: PD40 domain-containing protein [Verrucomicrobia bacterium]|nr:PD40 domain-containing protein [Verrucomicrobiota bacterium]
MRKLFILLSLNVVLLTRLAAPSTVAQPLGSIFYNYLDLSGGGTQIKLAAINPDGSGDQLVNLGLRNPAYPVWSRDGQLLAVAGNDPARPFKWSTDIFVVNTANNQTAKITAFEDTANASGFLTFYPSYLAFSPDRKRIAAGMVSYIGARSTIIYTNDTSNGQQVGPYDTVSKVSRCISLAVFPLDGSPGYLVANGLCDDDLAHPGEGIDWSPTQDLIAYPFNVTTTFSGAGGQFPLTAIHLTETTAGAADQGRRRQISFPGGQTGGPFDQITLAWQSDFAPSFSPDGLQIAYVRLLTWTTSAGVQPPSIPAIHIVGVDGANDREIAKFNQGDYITRISWSPDGAQLVFDLGRQALRDGFPLRTFDLQSVTLARMNADGTGFVQLRGAPATWPTWRPGTVTPPPTPGNGGGTAPALGVSLVRGVTPSLTISWPATAQNFVLESSPALGAAANWQTVNAQVSSGGGQNNVTITLNSNTRFFRLRSP